MKYNIISEIHKDDELLMYLRYNPKWYYILDNDESKYSSFIKQYKKDTGKDNISKVSRLSNQVSFFTSMYNYIKNSN